MNKKGFLFCTATLMGSAVFAAAITSASKSYDAPSISALSGATELTTTDNKYYQPRELIQVSQDSVVMAYNQSEASVFITSRSAYELYCRSSWLQVKQEGEDKLFLTAQKNEDFTTRLARIILTTKKENVSRVITVIQRPDPSHDRYFALPTTGNIYPLTDMDLTLATHDPWIKTVVKNKSIEGNKVKVKGNTYQTTVSTHANSTFKIKLNGAMRFVCDLGIDDEVLKVSDPSTHGDAIYKVLLDGKEVASGKLLLFDKTAVHLDVNTHDAKEMTLIFDSNGSNWGDHVDLCNPYFELTADKPVLIK